ncbi:hypothetical protein BAUCODRAFT_170321 [Baudoinia panamericana UAMH 10762]|uniref:Uncharacterized protein n=1 Tax=Baudoinia panamericana (strain UAMH 10762) TaxID=717646 RepID=M2M0E4_BAUPA|nr:uncharacterized protein BAUCODRAFT_170321 [Baudoinia panamericana UAMH 10762]EMD00473.1 hypothetical protein BAUCODRAFT_170321 [Baudoinia panamericana UAMH 10762]
MSTGDLMSDGLSTLPHVESVVTLRNGIEEHPLTSQCELSEPTPRASRSTPNTVCAPCGAVAVPFVDLALSLDRDIVDAGTEQDIWIAAEASVHAALYNAETLGHCTIYGSLRVLARPEEVDNTPCPGTITGLRLCFKPMNDCKVLKAVGQTATKDICIGQRRSLFLKVRVPKLSSAFEAGCSNQDSLFAELESMIGTFETDLLHVEARYRTSFLPHENVVTVRKAASVRRPNTDSRWSMVGVGDHVEASEQLHTKLAIYLADTYAPEKALRYIKRYLAEEAQAEEPVRQIKQKILDELSSRTTPADEHDFARVKAGPKPAVLITDTGDSDSLTSLPAPDAALKTRGSQQRLHVRTRSISLSAIKLSTPSSPLLPCSPRAVSASKTRIAATHIHADTEIHDEARKLWHHIRCSSQSSRQLSGTAPAQLEQLEATDENLKALRSQALANKRSIGAETLKGWRWDRTVLRSGEAPWL